jgi:hypothetical protein
VLAGVCGTDPFRIIPNFLDDLTRLGFAGVQNFPTVGLIGRALRLIVTYTPGGEEQALTVQPGFARHPAGDIVAWTRTGA